MNEDGRLPRCVAYPIIALLGAAIWGVIVGLVLLALAACAGPTPAPAPVCPPPPSSSFCKWDARLGQFTVPILAEILDVTVNVKDPVVSTELADVARRLCGNAAVAPMKPAAMRYEWAPRCDATGAPAVCAHAH